MTEERRLVTVLFADVTGSTAMGEELDPEDLRALLARYFAIAREVVASHDGTLEKFIGDAVMAVFGLPVAHGDDASRAVSAASELIDRVRNDSALGDRLPIRVGLNTGEVVAAREVSAGGEFLITGDAVNVAARLVQGAEPWTVVAGERTVRAADNDFEFEVLRPVEARGKSAPVRAGRLIRRREHDRKVVPLLGRDADLAQLDLVASRAFGEHRPYLVSVIAPAGTGKTRLVEEVAQHVHQQYPNAVVATAQLLPYGQRLTYWPLRSILFTLAGATEDTPTDALRTALAARLRDVDVEAPDAVAGRLLASIGSSEDEVVDRSDLFAAWRTVLEHVAAKQPLLVVFEDLHWSSETFLDLVEYVTQPRGESPLLMLVLTRPDLLDRRPAWGGGRRNHIAIALEPLDDRSIRELVGLLLETQSEEIVSAIADRSEGNPFYAGELVRALMDRLGHEPTRDDVVATLASLPDTVQATVLARLDALPTTQRRCLQLGAVFGRSFRPTGLAALDDSIAASADSAVESLLDRDMVRSAGADGYAFRHILIRDVAYGTLPRAERAHLHARAGAWLEERARGNEDAYAELIAYHYREAATLASLLPGEDETELKRKAVEWLSRAGDAALSARADLEARAHLAKALEWAPGELLPDINERIGDTYVGGDATVAAYDSAYRQARANGRPARDVFRILGKRLEYETRFIGSVANPTRPDDMAALVADGERLAKQVQDPALRARFEVGVAFYYDQWISTTAVNAALRAGEDAEKHARLALSMAQQADDPMLTSAALDIMASIAYGEGNWREALQRDEQRLTFLDRLTLNERIDAQSMVAWTAAQIGDLPRAEEITRTSLERIQPGQAPGFVLHLHNWHAVAMYWLGGWDQVLIDASRAERIWQDLGRVTPTYANGLFVSALSIARARGDADSERRWREVIATINAGGEKRTPLTQLAVTVARADFDAIAELLASLDRTSYPTLIAYYMSECADRAVRIPYEALERWRDLAVRQETPLLEGVARRSMALSTADEREAVLALAIFERLGAAPQSARISCELGFMVSNEELVQAGTAVLEALGDVDQLERYLVRRRASSPS